MIFQTIIDYTESAWKILNVPDKRVAAILTDIDSYQVDSYQIDGYQVDGYQVDSYQVDSYQVDSYQQELSAGHSQKKQVQSADY